MRIYSMTATFGKLEGKTLQLKPGLNIIEAPNEWGKSTWCAFLAAMLYGLDTRAKSTKTNLADKERYAPWSGSPMAGRLEIYWQGRDITIERNTKGRIPLGEFRAYETASGLPVPELTAANCGQTLLGVERSVFLRSSFIRFQNLPVTNDEALRRRLNALVTTGDENGGADKLAAGLKELKNRCRYNRTGLIPQAEGERKALEEKLRELEDLEDKKATLESRLTATERRIALLKNHRSALNYAEALRDRQQVTEARQQRDTAAVRLQELNELCGELPDGEQIYQMLAQIQKLEQEVKDLQMEQQMLHVEPAPLERPLFAENVPIRELMERTKSDGENYGKLTRKRPVCWIFTVLLLLSGLAAAWWHPIPGMTAALAGAAALFGLAITASRRKKAARALEARYGSSDPTAWMAEVERYCGELTRRKEVFRQQGERKAQLQTRWEQLEEKTRQMTQGVGLEESRQQWEQARALWDAQTDAGRDYQKAQRHLRALESMARPILESPAEDDLNLSREETRQQLAESREERTRLQNRLGQYAGRMEALGSKRQLLQQLEQVNTRLNRLEETYAALVLAQETLAQATAQLQRRFAPRIAKRAGQWMSDLTDGKYDRLQLGEDLSLLAGGAGENVLREALWRSDGTVDQLYLALRLAVAEELIPQGPLILDDALVRFDDVRLKAALELLKAQSAHRQVILFSCQSREKRMLS